MAPLALASWATAWATVLAMPKASRRALLRRRGWVRIWGYGAEAWRPPGGWTDKVYLLAAATKVALEQERGRSD